MATKPIDTGRKALPYGKSSRPGEPRRWQRKSGRPPVPTPITILERSTPSRDDVVFKGINGLLVLDKARIGDAIEVLVALLDLADSGLSEAEVTGAEDDFMEHRGWGVDGGPGCLVSDAPGGNVEDEGEDGDEDCCPAKDDIGTDQAPLGKIGFDHKIEGDCEDAEEGGDTELNGDEGDHSPGDY